MLLGKSLDGRIMVAAVVEGSHAHSFGILAGDIISEIDGETTRGMTAEEVASKMHGRSGTQINIRVVRNGVPDPIDYTITRAVIDASETLTGVSEDQYLEEVKALIESGADINAVDEFGEIALMKAAEDKHLGAMRVLIKAGANVNAVDREYGTTALMVASQNGHTEVVKVLIEAGG